MDVETTTAAAATTMKRVFLFINCIILAVGNCGGPLITRLYFIHGGKRVWFSSWLQTAAWPLILVPLLASYSRRRRISGGAARPVLMKRRVLASGVVIGALTGITDYLYVYGVSRLPVSTSALILASQLAFTAGFAFLLVRQRFTAYSVNAVVLLTVGAAVLGVHAGGDRPAGETSGAYLAGFLMTVATAVLYGLVLPLIEVAYRRAGQTVTFTVALEMQLVIAFVATAFCTVGMVVNNDFQAIAREAKASELGETNYYLVIVWSSIICQYFFLGVIGVIFYSSSLLSGILITVLLPITEILAVLFYREKFQAEKGISLFLSIWGFISYFYGEIKHNTTTKTNDNEDININQNQTKEETELALQTMVAP